MNLNLGDTQLIINEAKKQGVLRNQLAYILATAYHETGGKMKSVSENLNYSVDGLMKTFSRQRISKADCEKYGRKSGQSANQQAIANIIYGGDWGKKNLGNTKQGDGWLFRGRGFVQITGRNNYRKFGIENNPDKALDSKEAVSILITGMIDGLFTGKKLSNYITLQKSDFVNARRTVNVTDKAELIAGYAREYDRELLAIGYGVEKEPNQLPAGDYEQEENPLKSKRTWTWASVFAGAPVATFAGLHWSAQLVIVGGIMGLAIYAIVTMPAVKRKIESWFE